MTVPYVTVKFLSSLGLKELETPVSLTVVLNFRYGTCFDQGVP